MKFLLRSLIILCFAGFAWGQGQRDPGQEVVGELMVVVIYASDSSPEGLETSPSADQIAQLNAIETLKAEHYRVLGSDRKNVLRGYQNWAFPVKGSDRLMLSFQPLGEAQQTGRRLDLELWQGKQKILKADPVIQLDKPLYIKGPKWRGGQIILAVTLTQLLP